MNDARSAAGRPLDDETLRAWLDDLGLAVAAAGDRTWRVGRRTDKDWPFFVRRTSHWLLFAIVPLIPRDGPRPADLPRRLLAVNRDMRLCKLAYDEDGDVVLLAELPTESLSFAEVGDAVERMFRYAKHYEAYFTETT